MKIIPKEIAAFVTRMSVKETKKDFLANIPL